MDVIREVIMQAVEQLLGRSSGPLHARLVIQPIVATILAIRAGVRDAREGQPPFFWTWLTNKSERPRLTRSLWKDLGKILVLALVLDTIYQLLVLHAFMVVQAIIVATVVALLPYVALRGLVTRLVGGAKNAGTVAQP